MRDGNLLSHAEKLSILETVLERGSFRDAALALHVSQPAISQAIAALEKAVGAELLVRSRQGVTATAEGAALLQRVAPALATLRSVQLTARDTRTTTLRLGAYESLAMHVIPDLLLKFRAQYTNIELRVRTARSRAITELVAAGELDAGLVVEHEDVAANVRVDPIEHDALGLYASPDASLFEAKRRAKTPIEWAGFTFAEDAPAYYRDTLKAYGLRGRPALECDSFEALRALAARGVCASILPHRVARRGPWEVRHVEPPRGTSTEIGRHAIWLVRRAGAPSSTYELLRRELWARLRASD